MRLIDSNGYFVVHAPRQTGKTTAMAALARELTASGKYIAVLVSMEVGAGFPDDLERAELTILSDWGSQSGLNCRRGFIHRYGNHRMLPGNVSAT
ncbi:hypothetical protein [Candidatus Entotheonella palauensis]|nr:hypothetical protein [Candidatus Entotheonella palauensis]